MNVPTFRKHFLFSRAAFNSISCCQKRSLKTMQAWQVFGHGSTERLQLNPSAQVPPVTAQQNVLIKVHASSINPLDVRMLEGYGATYFNAMRQLTNFSLSKPEFPLVLGRDFSGTVEYVGPGVKSYKPGDEVWGVVNPWENGSHAEYVAANACTISKKPSSLSHSEAASFPYAALTAWSALSIFGALNEKNAYSKRVLVIGASGGVGTFAIQVLKAWGADVTAICSTDAMEMVTNLGADYVVDYKSPNVKAELKTLQAFDFIFDNVGGDYTNLTLPLLKSWKNCKYCTVVSPMLQNADEQGLIFGTLKSALQAGMNTVANLKDGRSYRWAFFVPDGRALKTISTMVDNKQITPVIEKSFDFENLPDAYRKVAEGHARGKTVINVIKPSETDTKT